MTLDDATQSGHGLVLGTALWGWGVEKAVAFEMLDIFVAEGGRLIDAATNYPINKKREDFGKASAWVEEWLKQNPGSGLRVMSKLGSIDNSGGPASLLGSSFVGLVTGFLEAQFQDALSIISIHWDNREDPESIGDTLSAFREIHGRGFGIGISGIKRPDLYRQLAPELAAAWTIQVKENLLNQQARNHYLPHFPDARYLAYGINMGGVKLEGPPGADSSVNLRGINIPDEDLSRIRRFIEKHKALRFAPASMNEVALMNACFTPGISGVIAGPRTADQLRQTMTFWNRLHQGAVRQEWDEFQLAQKAGAEDA